MSRKVELEWQVELKHSGYHLNGRGSTPTEATQDLIVRCNRQLDTATEEHNRLQTKIENVESYLEELETPK